MKSSRIIVAFAILTTLSGCQFGKNTTVPDDLIGVWKSSAPKYADRFFEITKDTILEPGTATLLSTPSGRLKQLVTLTTSYTPSPTWRQKEPYTTSPSTTLSQLVA